MDKVIRFNLKMDCEDRAKLLDFCLKVKEKFLVIGWSRIYKEIANGKTKKIEKFQDFYDAVKNNVRRINHAFNVFRDTKEDDLFWTRDMDALLPIVAYKIGRDVPGQIKASFNRPNGGIAGKIKDNIIVEYSKYTYNLYSS